MIKRLAYCFCLIAVIALNSRAYAQELQNFGLSTKSGLLLQKLFLADSTFLDLPDAQPLFSFELNGKYRQSDDVNATLSGQRFVLSFEESLRVTFASFGGRSSRMEGEIIFENEGFDTLVISNVLPFGENPGNIYITGSGPWNLARAWLNRPGYDPVRVILPDNAWELGYSSFRINEHISGSGLIRRDKNEGAILQRYNTVLPPGSSITFGFRSEIFSGSWQDGLRKVFRDRYLYDLYDFDNTLFEREDLAWIRGSYLIVLQFAWDRNFYDRFEGKYRYGEFLEGINRQFGYLDVFGIWPTWPRLGVDKRNQWDLYDDLPGGTGQLRSYARLSRLYKSRFFIAYNPWDTSTRTENPMAGMARLIQQVEADGVILDTRGSSSIELQASADSVRDGVVMYSEGMAVVSDMPGIISGRVHNAIFMSPEINLNKLIKPEFAIFRVCDVGEAPLHREIAISFFNGYGTELNLFRPGRDFQVEDDYDFLSLTTMMLRENSDAFLDRDWTPLIDTGIKNALVNRWGGGDKTLYTVLSMDHEGIDEPVIEIEAGTDYHFVSLWHSTELNPVLKGNSYLVNIRTMPFPESDEGTRREGSVDCVAQFKRYLKTGITNDSLNISSAVNGLVRIYRGNPGYGAEKVEFEIESDTSVSLADMFDRYEGKLVVQLHSGNYLRDVNIIYRSGAEPWLVSRFERTQPALKIPREMVAVPSAIMEYTVTANDNFVPYPLQGERVVSLDSFLIDRYPVSNQDYYRFVVATQYYPRDTVNYLRHWSDGIYQQGQENYPVVYVSYEDAVEYARWAGKRLPTEHEWQLAAQGGDKRLWPWGDEFHGTKCNNSFERATPVDAFPKGESPYGVFDMVGNVWQITADLYSNGTNYFNIIRGGSFYKPTSSWWYVEGGPQPLNKTQMLLLVSPGYDRNETVGFRCAKDVKR